MKKLSNFDLKVFAIIFMIIDHIGYFFSFALSSDVYITFRIIGRLAMPIFAYLVAEGIYYTKDIKKDLARRDFTINAMCFNLKTGIIDIYNGRNDVGRSIFKES